MITAMAAGEGGTRLIILGVARGNIDRLTAGQPLYVNAENHPGFPTDLKIVIFFGETEQDCVKTMKPFISDETKIIAVPKPGGKKGKAS
jgi:hypothetical protein